jgi:CO/xanthine dehydrogenase Mo-binding subunit
VKPAPFRYARPKSLAEALSLLAAAGGEAKLLAGGQSLVHDCGREMNPLIVEGMVHGSTVHGIGAALLEEFRYDGAGQLLTSTFMDYLKPTSADVPDIEVDHLEHPSPFTPLGAKGVGEGGAIPGPAAVANAVEDALAPFGAAIRSLPITPERVWRLMRTAP